MINDIISKNKTVSNSEISAGVQIKQAIIDLPKELIKHQSQMRKEGDNLKQYTLQFNEKFPHKNDLETKRNRLLEVNQIIKEKNKENNSESQNLSEDEAQENKTTEQNSTEQPRQTVRQQPAYMRPKM